MYQRKIPIELNCGLDLVKEVVFGKWKIHLIYFISQGAQRPAELQRKIPGATRRVLNAQLNQLESHGVIVKKIYAEMPPKVEYSLTDLGCSVLPIVTALGNWGDEHQEHLRRVIADTCIKHPELDAE
jgi:DNA-binding HxlR family transcriptional regulator